MQYQTLPLSQHPFLLSCESRERQPVRQGFAVHHSPFIVTFRPHPSRGAVREPTPEHSPGNKSLSMVWSQPLYQMSPWSVSKSQPLKDRSALATGPPEKMSVGKAIGIRD